MAYVELHTCSAFSFLRGGSVPEHIAEEAARLEVRGFALCDRDGLFGSPRQYSKAKELGLRPLVGVELTMEDESVLPVLVATQAGHRTLCEIITDAKLNAAKGEARIPWAALRDRTFGLVALTGDEDGPVRRVLATKGKEAAGSELSRIRDLFGQSVYVELQRHRARGEESFNRILIDMAESFEVPLVATNGVKHATSQARIVCDALTCLRHHRTLDTAGRLLFENSERRVKSTKEMRALFQDLPGALANTERIAEQLEFSLENLGYRFPDYPVPRGETMDSFLANMTFFGAQQRYGAVSQPVRRQLQRELEMIGRLGFSGYFLIVWDIVNFARQNGILVQGRGSAANSAVCYSLGVTAVDPIEGKLLFERFLSEGRKGWPDIDLDFPSGDRRESVIQEVFRKYTRRGTAMTANVICFKGRNAAREMGKILGFDEGMLGGFSELFADGDFPQTLELSQQFKMAGIPAEHPRLPSLVSLCQQIYGLPRHLGQHSGGMVIAHGRLDHVVPLENASMPNRSVIQWDKTDCEDLGIVKVDLLGLGMMAAMQDTLELCQERGRPVDLGRMPKNDSKTFDLLQRADAIGLFQVESRAQMATLPRFKPACFYDVAIQIAIIRPGPIQGEAVHPLLERRAGREPVSYPDERVKHILERTLGVTLFQEQIIAIAMQLGGFTADEADELRRAIGFTRSNERMIKMEDRLRIALRKNDVSEKATDTIVKSLSTFALYGFPESHALSFALIAYASAYLKVHRPAEFFAGLLNNQPMGFYNVSTLIQDARRHALRIKPVCVVASEWRTTVEGDSEIRIGIHHLKGLSAKAAQEMIQARTLSPFSSKEDFFRRTHFNEGDLQRLALAGALNVFTKDRRAALWYVSAALPADDLFSQVDLAAADLSPLEAMTHLERISADYQTQSLTVGDHPMKLMRGSLFGVTPAGELAKGRSGARVTIAGSVICRQRPGTAKGFVFVRLEDETGISNAIVTPQMYEANRLTISQEPSLLIHGALQIHEGVIHVKAERIRPLPKIGIPNVASHDFH